MQPLRSFFFLAALLAIGCTDLTAPSLLDGNWRQPDTVPGNSLSFTLSSSGLTPNASNGAVIGTGQWTGEACCAGSVTIAGASTAGAVHLTFTFYDSGQTTPRFAYVFVGQLTNSQTLAGTVTYSSGGTSSPITYQRVP